MRGLKRSGFYGGRIAAPMLISLAAVLADVATAGIANTKHNRRWEPVCASRFLAVCAALLVPAVVLLVAFGDVQPARAEYGNVVINNYSDAAGVRPVVFPHWFHRVRFTCKVCHSDLGFKFTAGGNEINMLKNINGQFCGACHNGRLAWSIENCDLCHSAKPGTPTQVHESTIQKLTAPLAIPSAGK